jgi:hypothetical protein
MFPDESPFFLFNSNIWIIQPIFMPIGTKRAKRGDFLGHKCPGGDQNL